ncbi:DUF4270 family protein [Desertivirga brevis]|uniref:DUF4270 family protein n=1 Tax=Desertivirga brevis TaxID=2810310 RepID=UPI001A95F5B5|nr:DUF4270 family protein [Pedobacter sp. SYSU D00873]
MLIRFTLPGFKSLLFLCTFLSLISCKKESAISIGNNAGTLGVTVSDTFTVTSSTLLLDSLPTAGSGLLLVGNIQDPELGFVKASTFFKLSIPGSTTVPEDAQLDSVRMTLTYSGYYYGDTTVSQELSIYQLTEKIAYRPVPGYIDPEEKNVFSSGSTYYNRSYFNSNPSPLITFQLSPKPKSKDTLFLKIPESLGAELFSLVKNGATEVSTAAEFENYFKGITIKAADAGNAVIGFKDTVLLNLYYSYAGANGLKEKSVISFSLSDKTSQFNRIVSDRRSLKIATLSDKLNIVSAVESDNKTYVQGGIGLVTKLEFPGLSYLTADPTIVINKAELIIQSPYGADKPFKLPQQLVLLLANKNNKPQQVYTDSYTNTSSASLFQAGDIDQVSSYIFPVTEYVSNYAKKYQNTSFLLSLPVSTIHQTLERAVIGSMANPKANIKLKITYTKN